MLDITSPFQHRTLTFNKERIVVSAQVTLEALHCLENVVENVLERQAIRITTMRSVLAIGSQLHSYPADWWQAVKQRFAPQWFLRRWPVEWCEFRTWESVCPHHDFPHVRDPKVHIAWMAKQQGIEWD